jgi:hypothetical protein
VSQQASLVKHFKLRLRSGLDLLVHVQRTVASESSASAIPASGTVQVTPKICRAHDWLVCRWLLGCACARWRLSLSIDRTWALFLGASG